MGFGAAGGVRGDGPQVPRDPGGLELVRELSVDLAHSPVRHGIGAFETLRLAAGRPLLLEHHLARLAAALAELGLPELPPTGDLREAIATAAAAHPDGRLRLVAADGRLLVAVAPAPVPPAGPVRVGLSGRIRRLAGAPTTRFKALSYLDNALLAREAAARGLFDVLALSERGLLADGGRCNLFIVIGGEVLTPRAAEDGALPGVVRGVLIDSGLAREAALAPADLARADAAFVTNSLIGVTPLSAIEPAREFGTGAGADAGTGAGTGAGTRANTRAAAEAARGAIEAARAAIEAAREAYARACAEP